MSDYKPQPIESVIRGALVLLVEDDFLQAGLFPWDGPEPRPKIEVFPHAMIDQLRTRFGEKATINVFVNYAASESDDVDEQIENLKSFEQAQSGEVRNDETDRLTNPYWSPGFQPDEYLKRLLVSNEYYDVANGSDMTDRARRQFLRWCELHEVKKGFRTRAYQANHPYRLVLSYSFLALPEGRDLIMLARSVYGVRVSVVGFNDPKVRDYCDALNVEFLDAIHDLNFCRPNAPYLFRAARQEPQTRHLLAVLNGEVHDNIFGDLDSNKPEYHEPIPPPIDLFLEYRTIEYDRGL
jgi:hypothetical protein